MRRRRSNGGGGHRHCRRRRSRDIGATSRRLSLRLANLLLVNLTGMRSPSELFTFCCQGNSSSSGSSRTSRWTGVSDRLFFLQLKISAATAVRAANVVTLDDLYPVRAATSSGDFLAGKPFSPRWVEELVADPPGCGSWNSTGYVWRDIGFAGNINS